ncbi:MAG: DUF309 domain-containing protein [Rhizobiaceae bacterium]
MSKAKETAGFALPKQAYLPGKTARPEEEAYDWIRDRTPAHVGSDNISHVQSWHYGLRLLREGFYWEAHEVLEPVWTACAPNSRERYLVQAIIQIANAALKAELGKPRAAGKLIVIAEGLLARSGSERLFGLDPVLAGLRLGEMSSLDTIEGQTIARAVFEA